jgi:hypothetical protein
VNGRLQFAILTVWETDRTKKHKTNRLVRLERITLPWGLNGSYSLVTPYGSLVFSVKNTKGEF